MTLDIIDMLINSDLPYQHKLRSIYELCNKQMKEYIRFGEIPKDEKSSHSLNCCFVDNRDCRYCIYFGCQIKEQFI